eukprot:CAMPEP_0197245590 /NCGR_PEP_ID=MMETSP1429-20130617/10332_1 /TAXON_ID=49237 /ORGANISM="Chaetoceros  sp., Strain UNC1202" /LENGTH=176 /DNA_ID=CAMNT_0042706121 /DNA_START=593 /DNA_END=1120 /DNA_ORIENTATION=-
MRGRPPGMSPGQVVSQQQGTPGPRRHKVNNPMQNQQARRGPMQSNQMRRMSVGPGGPGAVAGMPPNINPMQGGGGGIPLRRGSVASVGPGVGMPPNSRPRGAPPVSSPYGMMVNGGGGVGSVANSSNPPPTRYMVVQTPPGAAGPSSSRGPPPRGPPPRGPPPSGPPPRTLPPGVA